jgi:hypothetical protein
MTTALPVHTVYNKEQLIKSLHVSSRLYIAGPKYMVGGSSHSKAVDLSGVRGLAWTFSSTLTTPFHTLTVQEQ